MKLLHQYIHFLQDVSLGEYGEDFYNLAVCIRSEQVSPQQIQEHLKDKDFRDYYMKYFFGTHISGT
jgi:hypothetical protein